MSNNKASDLLFHKCVKRARKSLGLSQTKLGALLEVDQARVSVIESGKHYMTEVLFLDIADALDMTPLELMAFGMEDPS